MIRDIIYIVLGYLLGSILFARVFGELLVNKDITEDTADENPGASNAFNVGGFKCGMLTLCGDMLKGFLPVFMYLRGVPTGALALVIAAPVIGHVFPLFYRFHGGKGIATTFGCLLALFPELLPAALLAVFFLFFSLILRIMPHYHRTLVTYICTEIALLLLSDNPGIIIGFSLIFVTVVIRMLTSKEEKEPFEVSILWMH